MLNYLQLSLHCPSDFHIHLNFFGSYFFTQAACQGDRDDAYFLMYLSLSSESSDESESSELDVRWEMSLILLLQI